MTLNLFRDCSGITMSSTQELDVTSDCGQSFSVTMNQVPGSGQEVDQLCVGASAERLQQWRLPGHGALHLPGHGVPVPHLAMAGPWRGRTAAGTVRERAYEQRVDDIYADVTVNTVTAPCNDSPVFTAQPILRASGSR